MKKYLIILILVSCGKQAKEKTQPQEKLYSYSDYVAEQLEDETIHQNDRIETTGCLLYTSPSPRDRTRSRMPSSA